MDKKEIENHLKNAADQLFLNQPTIYHFTPETGKTEWNLAHHLAIEIHKLFPTFDCDLELTKHPANNRRPDIVLHERGCHSRNFLVIEIKATGDLRDTICDTRKIERHWFTSPYYYQFGAVMNFKRNKALHVEVLRNTKTALHKPSKS